MMRAVLARQNMAAWIMASGIVFGMAMFLTAVFSTNPWNDHTYSKASPIVAGMPSPHRDSRDKMVCSTCHIVVQAKRVAKSASVGLPIVQGTPAPHIDGREKLPCTGCHIVVPRGTDTFGAGLPSPKAVTVALPIVRSGPPPAQILSPEAHEWFMAYRFQGRVLQVGGTGARSVWGDVYVLVDDGINEPGWIDLAPRLFLEAAGCPVRAGLFVKGTAYRDPTGGSAGLAYAKTVTMNGEFCALRDSHLKGLWEDAETVDAEEK